MRQTPSTEKNGLIRHKQLIFFKWQLLASLGLILSFLREYMAFPTTFPEVGQEQKRQEAHSNGVALRGGPVTLWSVASRSGFCRSLVSGTFEGWEGWSTHRLGVRRGAFGIWAEGLYVLCCFSVPPWLLNWEFLKGQREGGRGVSAQEAAAGIQVRHLDFPACIAEAAKS